MALSMNDIRSGEVKIVRIIDAFPGYARHKLPSRANNARFFPSGMIASCVKTS